MSGALAGFKELSQRPKFDPAVAAAVMVLSDRPPLLELTQLNKALQAVAPHLSNAERGAWASVLVKRLSKAGITERHCVAAFLGQCAVESAGFRRLEEDLSYSAERLCEVWPHRFPSTEVATACARRPEALANRVYTKRMGNGDEASGDGWRFRGRGLIQISGRAAYLCFAQAAGMSLDQAVEYVATPAGAVESAVWFWTANQLNTLAENWSIDALTRKINGGLTGAAERNRLCAAALHAIGV